MADFNVLLGVSGSIACYKACEVVSALKKSGLGVDVVMTEHATRFVSPLTMSTLSARPVCAGMFDEVSDWDVKHVSLAKKADVFVVAPATANVIAKLASGIADDMLTSVALAVKCPKIICPAMNTAMYENAVTQENMRKLASSGWRFVDAESGRLACGDCGKGKLAQPEVIVEAVMKTLFPKRDFQGKRALVTAGGTAENIDGVRFIANRSSGKMGLEIAKSLYRRGAEVVLVAGNISVEIPSYLADVIRVSSTREMYDAVMSRCKECDIIVKAAAPSDYRVENVGADKLKGDKITLELVKNPDIARAVGAVKGERKLVVFCAETQDATERAKQKLIDKNADLIVANDVSLEGAGFDCDTNIADIIGRGGVVRKCEKMLKSQLADVIVDEIARL